MSTSPDAAPWYATSPALLRDPAALEALRAAIRVPSPVTAEARSAELEALVIRDPGALTIDAMGHGTLHTPEGDVSAGRFSIPSIASLRAALRSSTASVGHRARLSVLEGSDALTDIGALQATAPPGVLFQAASQFNCLESPDPEVVPVHEYVFDPTQGPRASVSALAGTLLRHHAAPAPDGTRFTQTTERCLNLLGDVVTPELAEVRCGYLSSHFVHEMPALAAALTSGFESLRVGLHDDVEVMFGSNWNGRPLRPGMRIGQVFTSTIAMGGYGQDDGSRAMAEVRRTLQRAAYVGTLFGAASVGRNTVVLTLIGGGVFGNPPAVIWDAIGFALREIDPYLAAPFHVVVAARTPLTSEQRALVRDRGGFIASFRDGDVHVLDAP
jgi:hypothetical protein